MRAGPFVKGGWYFCLSQVKTSSSSSEKGQQRSVSVCERERERENKRSPARSSDGRPAAGGRYLSALEWFVAAGAGAAQSNAVPGDHLPEGVASSGRLPRMARRRVVGEGGGLSETAPASEIPPSRLDASGRVIGTDRRLLRLPRSRPGRGGCPFLWEAVSERAAGGGRPGMRPRGATWASRKGLVAEQRTHSSPVYYDDHRICQES